MQQQTVSPQMPVENTPQSHGLRNLFLVLASLIILAGIGGAGYYLGIKNSMKSIISNKNISSTVTTSPTTDPTASWSSYLEKAINLTVKYPPTWSYVEQKTAISSQFLDGINGVTFSGAEGQIIILWGSGFGGGCPVQNQTVDFNGSTGQVCNTVSAQNGNYTWIINNKTSTNSFEIKATANACSGSGCGPQTQGQMQQALTSNKQFILSMLEHVNFSAPTK